MVAPPKRVWPLPHLKGGGSADPEAGGLWAAALRSLADRAVPACRL